MNLLERVDRRTQALVREEQDRLETWFGDTRIVPRFRTPLEKAIEAETPAG